MSGRFDQPFYIPIHHPLRKRWGAYLPPLEWPEEPIDEPIEDLPNYNLFRDLRQLKDVIDQLRGQANYLENKLNEHIDKSRRRIRKWD